MIRRTRICNVLRFYSSNVKISWNSIGPLMMKEWTTDPEFSINASTLIWLRFWATWHLICLMSLTQRWREIALGYVCNRELSRACPFSQVHAWCLFHDKIVHNSHPQYTEYFSPKIHFGLIVKAKWKHCELSVIIFVTILDSFLQLKDILNLQKCHLKCWTERNVF